MKYAVVALAALLMPVVGMAGASGPEEQRIEYTTFAQAHNGYCGGGGNVGNALFHVLGAVTDLTGQAFSDPDTYCLGPPRGAASLTVAVADEQSETVYARVAQLVDGDAFRWDDVCGAGAIEIDAATEAVTLSLKPYGQTSGSCLQAGPPTQGVVMLGWA